MSACAKCVGAVHLCSVCWLTSLLHEGEEIVQELLALGVVTQLVQLGGGGILFSKCYMYFINEIL